MNVLVTGGAGYVGSHVVLELLNNGYNVIVFDDLSTGNEKNINPQSTFFKGTILSYSDLNKVFKHKIDFIIHLAASKAAAESMSNPLKFLKNNVIGTSMLLTCCLEHNVKNIIFSSSAAVYGTPEYLPIDEKHSTIPINYYGETKLQIERNLAWIEKNSNINFVSLRYFNAAGYHINGKVEGLEKKTQNLIPNVMEYLLGNRKKISIFGGNYKTKDGTAVRDYIHVQDLARAHVLSMNYLKRFKKSTILNLGTNMGYSVLDIINECELVTKKRINYQIEKKRIGDCASLISDFRKAKKNLDWNPIYSDLNTIIDSTWKVYKKSKT